MSIKYFGNGSLQFVLCLFIFLLSPCEFGHLAWAGEHLPVPVKDGYNIYYENVVDVDDKLKKENLFLRTKQWVAQNYTTSAMYNPIQLEDRDNGLIIVRIYFKFSTEFFIHQADYTVQCIGKIQLKDGKYKYTFSDFTYLCSSTNKHYEEKEPKSCDHLIYNYEDEDTSSGTYAQALRGLNEGMQKIIATLHQSLTEPNDF